MNITAKSFKFIIPEIIHHKSLHHPNVVNFIEAYFISEDKQLWVLYLNSMFILKIYD